MYARWAYYLAHTWNRDCSPFLPTFYNLWFCPEFYERDNKIQPCPCNFFRGMFLFLDKVLREIVSIYKWLLHKVSNKVSKRLNLALRAIRITIFKEHTCKVPSSCVFHGQRFNSSVIFQYSTSVEWRAWNIAYRVARALPDGPSLSQIQ